MFELKTAGPPLDTVCDCGAAAITGSATPDCERMTGWPAISMVVVRAAPVLAARLTVTTPVPVPPAPGVTNGSVAVGAYVLPGCVTTRNDSVLAVAGAVVAPGLTK